MPRRSLTESEIQELEAQKKLLNEKAKYERFIEQSLRGNILRRIEKVKDTIRESENFIKNVSNDIKLNPKDFSFMEKVEEFFELFGIKDCERLTEYIKEKITPQTIKLSMSADNLLKIHELCLDYLREFTLKNADFKTQYPNLYSFILKKTADDKISIKFSRDPIAFWQEMLIKVQMQVTDLDESEKKVFQEALLSFFQKFDSEKKGPLANIQQALDLNKKIICHMSSFLTEKKIPEAEKQLSEFISKHKNNFVFSNEQERRFNDALERGNLNDLININEELPFGYKKEVELQQNFKGELKEKFQKAFSTALKGEKLQDFVTNNIGSKIIGQFPQYKKKNGEIDFEAFAKDISKLKDKNNMLDNILEKIIEVFYKLVSVFGVEENKIRNGDKEKFYSTMVETTNNLSTLPAPSVEKNNNDNGKKRENKHK